MLTYGTLFSGIDGFAVAFDRLGWDLRWQVELDDFCHAVLQHHWPDVPKHRDVRDVGGRNLERVDVLAGGFPCQGISLAGEGAGLDDPRSGLWSEMFRVIRELRPRYVVVENVAALLGRGLGAVLGDLASIGFDAEWDCIPASALGAPHRRDRIWIVAYPRGGGRQQGQPDVPAWQPDAEGRGRDLPDAEGELRGSGLRAGEPGALGRDESADVRGALAHANGEGQPQQGGAIREVGRRTGDSGSEARRVADTESKRQEGPGPTGSTATVRRRLADPGQTNVQDADSGALQPWRVGGRAAQAGGPEWWSVEPPVGRVADGVPNRLDQLAALGNALVPQVPEWIGQRIIEWEELDAAA